MSDPSVFRHSECLQGDLVQLRLLAAEDCNERYVQWLQDPEVNQFLETRWQTQTLDTVRAFVASMVSDPASYLFGIFIDSGQRHLGNLKIGPVNKHHGFADISFFIGERVFWGKGIATDAIRTATRCGFERMKLHRIQAGVYASNVGSARALERVGYQREGRLRSRVLGPNGREDLYGYGILAGELRPRPTTNGTPKVLAVLQARTTSSRLPGKVLKPILGVPMLARQIERIRLSREIDKLIVATSDEPSDDSVAELCATLGVTCFRGSLNDVLDRFYRAAAPLSPEYVVRLTGDCPLADPDVIDAAIRVCRPGDFDYVTNALDGRYPDGLDVEVFRFECLQQAHLEAQLPSQREHVTPFINRQPDRFKIGHLRSEVDLSMLRWTVDEPEDFRLITLIYEALYPINPAFRMRDVLLLLEEHPEWKSMNAFHKRNAGYERSLERDREQMGKVR
jgi:spore coat polysaccharide biosynthesis protein SpsF